jgi:hypothetical protein
MLCSASDAGQVEAIESSSIVKSATEHLQSGIRSWKAGGWMREVSDPAEVVTLFDGAGAGYEAYLKE